MKPIDLSARRGTGVAIALSLALSLFCLANAVAMLAMPVRWFWAVPGVPLTGGYNAHFIRDIGIVYGLAAAGLATGALRPDYRLILWGLAAAWLGTHALFHLIEVAAGLCGPEAIPRDFLGVTFPALVALGLVGWAAVARAAPGPRKI